MKIDDALRELVTPGATWKNGSDFWAALCILCHKEAVSEPDAFARVIGRFEHEYRRLTGATKMPEKYRSAKSVIAKAVSTGVAYVDKNGTPRSKSAVYYNK